MLSDGLDGSPPAVRLPADAPAWSASPGQPPPPWPPPPPTSPPPCAARRRPRARGRRPHPAMTPVRTATRRAHAAAARRSCADPRSSRSHRAPGLFQRISEDVGHAIEAVVRWFCAALPTPCSAIPWAHAAHASFGGASDLVLVALGAVARRPCVACSGPALSPGTSPPGTGADAEAARRSPPCRGLPRSRGRRRAAGDLDLALRLRFEAGLERLEDRGVLSSAPTLTTGDDRRGGLGPPTFDELASVARARRLRGRAGHRARRGRRRSSAGPRWPRGSTRRRGADVSDPSIVDVPRGGAAAAWGRVPLVLRVLALAVAAVLIGEYLNLFFGSVLGTRTVPSAPTSPASLAPNGTAAFVRLLAGAHRDVRSTAAPLDDSERPAWRDAASSSIRRRVTTEDLAVVRAAVAGGGRVVFVGAAPSGPGPLLAAGGRGHRFAAAPAGPVSPPRRRDVALRRRVAHDGRGALSTSRRGPRRRRAGRTARSSRARAPSSWVGSSRRCATPTSRSRTTPRSRWNLAGPRRGRVVVVDAADLALPATGVGSALAARRGGSRGSRSQPLAAAAWLVSAARRFGPLERRARALAPAARRRTPRRWARCSPRMPAASVADGDRARRRRRARPRCCGGCDWTSDVGHAELARGCRGAWASPSGS